MALIDRIGRYLQEREHEKIPGVKGAILSLIADTLREQLRANGRAQIMFVCTHNSRRSQLAQAWLNVAADHYDIRNVDIYSGGSEVTRFYPAAIAALERAGLDVRIPAGSNPEVTLRCGRERQRTWTQYSKRFDTAGHPKTGFLAVVNCPQADEGCPVIPGAVTRLTCFYDDPKVSDRTPHQAAVYDERCAEIARDSLFTMRRLSDLL